MESIVATGSWLYDGTAPTVIRIVQLDYDFWYAIGEADGELDTDDAPALNEDGHLYYVRTRPGWSVGEPFWPDSPGFPTQSDAKEAAQALVPNVINWR